MASDLKENIDNRLKLRHSFSRSSSSKSKFAIDWFYSGKKDEIVNLKTTVKLGEDLEPISMFIDPKDSKSVLALCINK